MTEPFELAIVISAWKPDYLRAALASIRRQTDTHFVCRIFDDAAPEQVAQICAEFPEFRYERFDTNLGGQSLVAQWNRCLARVPEPWVWFFSDDDVMPDDGVSAFRRARDCHPQCVVFQARVDMVSVDLRQTLWTSSPPAWEPAAQFLAERFGQRRLSCMPDHMFHRPSLLTLNGGFVDFPLAWNTDDATWVLLGAEHGIAAVASSPVLWRQSDQNISNDIGKRWIKLGADLQYLDWLADRHLLPADGRTVQRWLGTRIRRVYRMGLAELGSLLRSLPVRRWPALMWALGVAVRDALR